jgi:hypothetical protein
MAAFDLQAIVATTLEAIPCPHKTAGRKFPAVISPPPLYHPLVLPVLTIDPQEREAVRPSASRTHGEAARRSERQLYLLFALGNSRTYAVRPASAMACRKPTQGGHGPQDRRPPPKGWSHGGRPGPIMRRPKRQPRTKAGARQSDSEPEILDKRQVSRELPPASAPSAQPFPMARKPHLYYECRVVWRPRPGGGGKGLWNANSWTTTW